MRIFKLEEKGKEKLSLFPHFSDEMDAASDGEGRESSVLLSIWVTWRCFLAAGGRNHFPKTAELTDLPTKVMNIVAVIGKCLYPMVSRNLEGPENKGTRRIELKGKDGLEQMVFALLPVSGDQGELLVNGK